MTTELDEELPELPECLEGIDGILSWAVLLNPLTGREYTISLERITPEMALAYKDSSAGNRKEKGDTVEGKYAPDMKDGRWALNGETIVFDVNGNLRDGHNRMRAIMRSQTPIVTFVIRGIDPEGVVTIDTGVSRSFADHLIISGRGVHADTVATIARIYAAYDSTGDLALRRRPVMSNTGIDAAVTNEEVFREIQVASRFITSAFKLPYRERQIMKVPRGVFGFMFLIFSRKDAALAAHFFERIANAVGDGSWNHQAGDPEYAFRRRMIQALSGRERITDFEITFMLVQAWNYRMSGLLYDRAQVPKGNEIPEVKEAVAEAYTRPLRK